MNKEQSKGPEAQPDAFPFVSGCETCSAEVVEPGYLVINDVQRWLCLPTRCHECESRSLARWRQFGADLAKSQQDAIYDALNGRFGEHSR